ncbi:unnamed protein product [Caenorhabditis bovis]|uniref:Uncharacterized protein n=1 Tax=Caenorhabditis bovis TaxID=2654633 RepID=A0A8S1F9W5_9PELO|nr:unnamed protein product [Caenorhabditis bovis]
MAVVRIIKKQPPPAVHTISVTIYSVKSFQETETSMYVEMHKTNVGEFTWDQNCTRIDALVRPIVELDRTTTPEIPIAVELID